MSSALTSSDSASSLSGSLISSNMSSIDSDIVKKCTEIFLQGENNLKSDEELKTSVDSFLSAVSIHVEDEFNEIYPEAKGSLNSDNRKDEAPEDSHTSLKCSNAVLINCSSQDLI